MYLSYILFPWATLLANWTAVVSLIASIPVLTLDINPGVSAATSPATSPATVVTVSIASLTPPPKGVGRPPVAWLISSAVV